MSSPGTGTNPERRHTRGRYSDDGTCGYQGRLLVTQNGEYEMVEAGVGGAPGPHGRCEER